jgi:hypothetical protein
MTPSAKEGSYESQSLPGRNPKTVTLQAIALSLGPFSLTDKRPKKRSNYAGLRWLKVRGAKPRAKKKIIKCPVIMEHF